MFEKLEQLAKDNKKISDFHLRAGSPMAYRQTGEIIKVPDAMVTAQDLQDLLLLLLYISIRYYIDLFHLINFLFPFIKIP